MFKHAVLVSSSDIVAFAFAILIDWKKNYAHTTNYHRTGNLQPKCRIPTGRRGRNTAS